MRRFLHEELAFRKLPYGDLFERNDVFVQSIVTESSKRTFVIKEQNISWYKFNYCKQFFLLIELKDINKFILLDKEQYLKLINIFVPDKAGKKRWICKFNILPKVFECAETVVIQNKYASEDDILVHLLIDETDVVELIRNDIETDELLY